MKRVLVIGGGAAGVMAAITAAQYKADVTVYEKKDRILKKVLSTGNGKCNFSNRDLSVNHYYTKEKEKLRKCFEQFDAEDTISFFHSCGMLMKDKNGYLYPACEQASVVVDILRKRMNQLNIRVCTQVDKIRIANRKEDGITVESTEGRADFDRVIFACGSPAGTRDLAGSCGYGYAQELGHTIVPIHPGLVQICCLESFYPAIAGVRTEAEVTLCCGKTEQCKERGELQFTNYGISGIPVFQFSRMIPAHLAKQSDFQIFIDFMPDYLSEEWKAYIETRFLTGIGETYENFFLGTIHKKLILMLLKKNGIRPGNIITKECHENVIHLAMEMKHFCIIPKCVNSMEHAQVCAGGVDFAELREDFSSVFADHIYFCGEMIDVDGKCGGYNLQWAWTSGYLAGRAAAR